MPMPHHPILFAALFAIAGLTAGPASAAPEDAPRDIGGWTVAVSKDGTGCFATKAYDRPGNTTLLLGLDLDGKNHLSVLNANWSIRPQDRLKLDFHLTNGGYTKHFAIGMASDGQQGFVTSFETKFPTYFGTSKTLDIARGTVPVERLDLAGSGAAVAALRHCVEAQRDKPASATSQDVGIDGIPRDPFAAASTRKAKK